MRGLTGRMVRTRLNTGGGRHWGRHRSVQQPPITRHQPSPPTTHYHYRTSHITLTALLLHFFICSIRIRIRNVISKQFFFYLLIIYLMFVVSVLLPLLILILLSLNLDLKALCQSAQLILLILTQKIDRFTLCLLCRIDEYGI